MLCYFLLQGIFPVRISVGKLLTQPIDIESGVDPRRDIHAIPLGMRTKFFIFFQPVLYLLQRYCQNEITRMEK